MLLIYVTEAVVVLVLIFCTRYLVPGYEQTSIESGERLQRAMRALCESLMDTISNRTLTGHNLLYLGRLFGTL